VHGYFCGSTVPRVTSRRVGQGCDTNSPIGGLREPPGWKVGPLPPHNTARTHASVDEHGFVARITRPSTARILESTHTTEKMTSIAVIDAEKQRGSNKITQTLKGVAVGAAIGMAITIGVAYPTLKDKWTSSDAPAPLACADAQPQSPRDVSTGYSGTLKAKAAAYDGTVSALTHVNTHYHLGAEHKSSGQYDKLHTTTGRKLLSGETEYGFYCDDAVGTLSTAQKTEYNWQYCKETEVGKTYEVHYVYSSGGKKIGDGLGGAFAVQNNPTVVVRGQVFHIVNDDDYDLPSGNLMDGMVQTFPGTGSSTTSLSLSDVIVYAGSTTGRSYNNDDSCSPYQINWQVDQNCHLISAKSFDAMCKKMKEEYDMSADTHPHQSRDLVSKALASDAQGTLQTY